MRRSVVTLAAVLLTGCTVPGVARPDAEREVRAVVDGVIATVAPGRPTAPSGGDGDPWSVGACGVGMGTGERSQYGQVVPLEAADVAAAQHRTRALWEEAGYEVGIETPRLLVAERRGFRFGLWIQDSPGRALVSGSTPCYP